MAWIPILNFYLMFKIAKAPTKIFVLSIAVPITLYLLMFIGQIMDPVAGAIFGILYSLSILAVIGVNIWLWWKIADARGKQGWIGLLMLVPIANIIVPGYLAWSK